MKITKKIYALICLVIIIAVLGIGMHKLIPTDAIPFVGKTVVIDAGHGIPDGGASSASGIQESEINLKIAKSLKKLLTKNKVKVIMTRSGENSLSDSETNNKRDDLNKRCEIREKSNADIFVSIHLNHFEESQYSGAQVFYNSGNAENEILAKCIQDSIIELADPENTRNIKADNSIYVLKNASMPSVLVECGFLSNPDEAEKLNTKKYQEKIAHAIYCGIAKYALMDSE